MTYTIKEALKLEGVPSERTLRRHLKDGTLSSDKDQRGHIKIAATELHRVYKIRVATDEEGDANGIAKKTATPQHGIDNATDKNAKQSKDLSPLVEAERELKENYKAQADEWKNRYDDLMIKFVRKDEIVQSLLPAPAATVTKSFPWGRAVAASLVIASLAVGGTIAVLSPEKLAFLNVNEPQAVAAIPSDATLRAIAPAAGMPIEAVEEGTQQPFSSLEEDATKN